MKYPDLSIDIETLGTKFNAPVMAIGACAFNRDTGKIGPTMYLPIDWYTAMKAGVADGNTIAWWVRQGDAAKKLFDDSQESLSRQVPLATALHGLINFCRDELEPTFRPWGNGATFDITILEHAYEVGAIGLKPAWSYPHVRDLRTLVDAAESLAGFDKKKVKRIGVHHNAVDDAIYQAHVCINAWACMKSTKGAAVTQKPTTPPTDEDDEL